MCKCFPSFIVSLSEGLNHQNRVKNSQKRWEKTKHTGKEQASRNKEAIINRFENRTRKSVQPIVFYLTWKDKSQMKSALEDDKPFFFFFG